MAETVTITTFLELKDNMSAGLGKVEAALKKIGGAQTAQTKADKEQAKAKKEQEKAAEKLAKMQQRAARFEEQAAKARQREFDASAKKAQAASDRALRDIQKKEAAKQIEARKTQAFISRSLLENQEKHRKDAAQQARIARGVAKAQEREQRQIERSRLGPKYDPAARSQQQLRDTQRIAAAQQRAASQVARAREMAQERARAKEARDVAKAKKDFQRWGQQEAKAHERLEKQKANATIREQRRVDAALSRASKRAAKEARDVARAQAQSKKEDSAFIGKAGASMFGKSAGGFISAGFVSPQAGLGLVAVAIADSIVTGVKRGLETAFELTRDFVVKVFDVGKAYQENTRRIGMTLVGMDVSPTYEIATQQAAKFYDTLQTLSAKLPGETQDYVSVFSQGLPMALEQGEKSINRFAEMASKYTAVAFTRGVKDVEHMGRDIERIMQGNALSTTRMYRELRPYIGMLAKDFNKLAPEKRMEALYAGIEKAASGLSGTLHDADAVVGTLQSHIEQIFRIGGAPLFASSLRIIETINKFLSDNKQTITETVNLISGRLGNVLEGAVIKILEISTHFGDVYDAVASIGDLLSNWGFLINPFVGVLAHISGMVVDLGKQLEQIGLKSEMARLKERRQEKYETLGKAYLDPKVQQWMKTMPRTGFELAEAETGVTRDNEKAIKSWAQAGLKMGIPKEQWALVLQEAHGIQANQDKVTEWFTSSMPTREPLDTAGLKKAAKAAPKERASTINDFRFSKFDIRQEFAEGFDPDRIAVAFASDLAKLGEMRMQSAYAPLYSVMGG